RLHTSIYLVISALSNKYPSLILSKKLSDFIYPENIAHLENLRSAGSLFADTMINRLYFHGPTELNQFDNVPEKQPLLFDKPSLAAGIGTDSTILLENKILIDHIRDWMENSIPGEKHNKSTITIPTESLMDLGTHGIRLFNLISSSETFPPNTKINLVFNKCTNYGPMINCTFADVSMSKKYGYLITSLKYIRPDTVSVVNVGALDIVNIHHGDSIHIQSPLSVSALVQTPGYIKINMSIFNKDKNDDVFFDLSFRPDLIGKEVMLEVEKQGHHGQFINIYLQEEDNISIKKDALIARYQLSPSLNHVSFFPEDLGTLDLYAIYKGLKVSERPRKFNINVSEIDTFGNGICRLRIYPNTRDEEQLTFQIPHEYIKDPSKINAVLYIKNHKDYEHYVELRVDNKIVQHYRYSKTIGKFMKVNFPRLKLIDYILNNTNKEHQAISPCKYEHNDIIEPTGTLTLSYMGRTCSLFDLEPLIGTKPVFIPVHDKKTGYKIFMHDIAKYKLDPERTPDIILKKSVLFGTLIPEKSFLSGNRKKSKTISDKTLSDKKAAFLIKARVFANKGHFSYALNILRGYFKNFSKDKKVKQLYNKLLLLESLELSESTADPFYFISSQEKEFFLNLHNFGQSITENNDFTVPEYFKNFLTRSSPELTDEFYIKLIENINFEILHEHQAFVNIGIFTLLLKLPDTYQTIGLLKKLAEFIDYPGKYNNVLLPVARKLFTTFRIKSIIKLLNQTNNTKLQRFLSPMVKFKNKADTTYGEKDTEKDDEGGDLLDDFDQFEKGSPAKAMSVIIRNFGFNVFPKTALYPLRIKNWATKETYSEGTVDLEVRILKKLGILIMIKPGFYKLTSVLKGITPEETNLNIGSIYNLELKIGRTKIPLDRYEIPNEDIPTVKAIVQMQLAHILHKKTLTERPINQDQYKINIWKGYAAPKQMSFLTEAQKLNKKGSFEIRFNDLETLVSSACASAQTKNRNIVTILPYDLLSDAQILKLSDSNAQIIYMNIDKDYLNAYDCIQLEGIIATGAAYLSGNNITFNKLYKLLSETENNITVTLEELKLTPSLAKDFIFTLTPITIKNYNELKLINDRMRHFLQAA
ncbi:MAG: hypothetical protein KAI70_02815, partial [Candidatus Omnitrophica bacterium]|nr:hypothetical protein [Candidatus Omnitrophota bacterium]